MPKRLLNDNRIWNAFGSLFGKESYRRVATAQVKRLVFVCTGNICRSPYAEVWARERLGLSQPIISRGLFTTPGKSADGTACLIARERGIDLSSHHTESFNPKEIRAGDLILVMDRTHYSEIASRAPELKSQLTLLGAFSAESELIISDPWGKDLETFRNCFSQIEKNLSALGELIRGS